LEQKAQDLGQRLKQQLLGKEVVRQVAFYDLRPSLLLHAWFSCTRHWPAWTEPDATRAGLVKKLAEHAGGCERARSSSAAQSSHILPVVAL